MIGQSGTVHILLLDHTNSFICMETVSLAD